MAKKTIAKRMEGSAEDHRRAPQQVRPTIPAESAFSFLKETKGVVSWHLGDVVRSLKIGRADAENVLAMLGAQGYVKRMNTDEWMTTDAGEAVSGARLPRFTRESVQEAVESLKKRIKETNQDAKALYRIDRAVAFGDFLLRDRTRVQAADVGMELRARGETSPSHSATMARAERAFLRQLRQRSALLQIRPCSAWMSARSHIDLL